jgi:hypothetical protein
MFVIAGNAGSACKQSTSKTNSSDPRRTGAQLAATHFKCCRYRRRQDRCRPGPDLDPDLGQLVLGRRRPGLDPD